MLSWQEDEAERRAVLENDRRLRDQQGTTFHQFAESDAHIPGRFAAFSATVVGSTGDIAANYPAAAPHQFDPVADEPPLGFSVEEMIPVGPDNSLVSGEGPASAPGHVLDAGPPNHRTGLVPDGPAPDALPSVRADEGRVSSFRRRRL